MNRPVSVLPIRSFDKKALATARWLLILDSLWYVATMVVSATHYNFLEWLLVGLLIIVNVAVIYLAIKKLRNPLKMLNQAHLNYLRWSGTILCIVLFAILFDSLTSNSATANVFEAVAAYVCLANNCVMLHTVKFFTETNYYAEVKK